MRTWRSGLWISPLRLIARAPTSLSRPTKCESSSPCNLPGSYSFTRSNLSSQLIATGVHLALLDHEPLICQRYSLSRGSKKSSCRSKLKEQNDVDVACHIEAESGNISKATLKVYCLAGTHLPTRIMNLDSALVSLSLP